MTYMSMGVLVYICHEQTPQSGWISNDASSNFNWTFHWNYTSKPRNIQACRRQKFTCPGGRHTQKRYSERNGLRCEAEKSKEELPEGNISAHNQSRPGPEWWRNGLNLILAFCREYYKRSIYQIFSIASLALGEVCEIFGRYALIGCVSKGAFAVTHMHWLYLA